MIQRIELTELLRYQVARRALLAHLGAIVGALDEMPQQPTKETAALMEQAVVACRVLRDRVERAREQK